MSKQEILNFLADSKLKAIQTQTNHSKQEYFQLLNQYLDRFSSDIDVTAIYSDKIYQLNRLVDNEIAKRKAKTQVQKPDYFKSGVDLTEQNQKYCRCVLHVSADQPKWCIKERFPGSKEKPERREGRTCYNPYAVCTKTVSRKGRVECFLNYDLDNIPAREIETLVDLKQKLLNKYHLPSNIDGLRQLQSIITNKK